MSCLSKNVELLHVGRMLVDVPARFIMLLFRRFLTDRQRMNVALTRARHALYVFGHMETLKVGKYTQLLFYPHSRHSLIPKTTLVITATSFLRILSGRIPRLESFDRKCGKERMFLSSQIFIRGTVDSFH